MDDGSKVDSDVALIVAAAAFAAGRHRDQRRKNGDVPYINHPLEVARILSREGGIAGAEVLAAAILHDTVEDTATSAEELEREFGGRVAGIVAEVTDDKSLPKVERKRRQIRHAREISTAASLVKLADKLSNLRELAAAPPPSWDALRIRGYFVWAHAVVAAIGRVNDRLCDELEHLFASAIVAGGQRSRAVPEDAAERHALLERYYRALEGLDD